MKANVKKDAISAGEVLMKTFLFGIKVKTPVSILISVLSIPAALLPLLLSKQLQKMTDLLVLLSIDGKEGFWPVVKALIFLGVLFLTQHLSNFAIEYYAIKDKFRTLFYIKEYVLQQVSSVHYSYIENRDDFMKKIEFADSFSVKEMSRNIQAVFIVLRQLVTFISISIALWAVRPDFVFILLATGISAAILSYKQSDESFRHRAKWSEEGSLAIHYFHLCSSLSCGIQELRHYELFDYLKARWRAVADDYLFKKNKLASKHLKVNLLADFFRSSVYFGILILTAWEIYQNPLLGVGTFTLVYTLSDKLQKSVSSILTEMMQFSVSLLYLKDFFSLEKLEREYPEEVASKKGQAGNGRITFDHVSFSYPGCEQQVLKDISISIQGGEKVAVVGENGSGKSTFINLLTGLYSPDRGKIEIDDLSMEAYKKDLRSNISVIFQDFAHYDGTIRENITVSDSKRSLSDGEIMELARKIHVEDVIIEQPNGLEEQVGRLSAKGNDLSGGQWQKIALLRAVYRDNTNIMILDEPTAALDPLAEAELYRNFAQITGERTTLLISHRLGIAKQVDRILVFHEGQIVEDGSHEELMSRKGYYYKMYQAQAGWYQEEA